MHNDPALDALSRDELYELAALYAKNWLAMDGYWFQSIERKHGMGEAMEHDIAVWRGFTRTEARRIRAFLNLPEQCGLAGLARALDYRMYARINRHEIVWESETAFVYRTLTCRVQNKRHTKGMEYHPCKTVGLTEYAGFAAELDARIQCECVSCYPDVTDGTCSCAWRFWLETT